MTVFLGPGGDAGIGSYSVFASDATGYTRNSVNAAGDTTETLLKAVTLPILGPNDRVRVTTIWGYTNSANNKQLRARLGGTSGTLFLAAVPTASTWSRDVREFVNVGSVSSQKMLPSAATPVGGFGTTNSGNPATMAVNMGIAQDIAFMCSFALAVAGESITLHDYVIEIARMGG